MRIVDACLLGSVLFFAPAASAQNIFADGFEDGNACGWSAVVEAEETEATAEPLPDSTDCDDDIRSFSGTLYGADDVDFFRERGASFLITTTPVIEGRSFGTNLMEAAILAASGESRRMSTSEVKAKVKALAWKPTIRDLR